MIDFKTFVRLTYSKENLYMIKDIEKKHFDDLTKLVKFNIKNLILLVDFVFILNIVNIMNSYFKDKDLKIKCANNGLNILFLLFFNDKANSNNECSILFDENILSYESVNQIKNLNNFIDYYYEINESFNENKLDYFPIYDPINDKNHYFLSIITTKYENEDVLVVFCSSFLDFEDISFDLYDNYKYILILFQSYDFRNNENICDSISKFYFKKEADFIDYIPNNFNIIFDGKSFNLIFFGKSSKNNIAVLDRQTARIQFKFIVKNAPNCKYMIDANNIIDKKIKIIIDKIIFKNMEGIDILIEESFNIIYSYLNKIYNKSNILILNGIKNNDIDAIKNTISMNIKKEIKEYLLEFLNKNSELKFDLIISANNLYLENENIS